MPGELEERHTILVGLVLLHPIATNFLPMTTDQLAAQTVVTVDFQDLAFLNVSTVIAHAQN